MQADAANACAGASSLCTSGEKASIETGPR
jgi:hypothetical protein